MVRGPLAVRVAAPVLLASACAVASPAPAPAPSTPPSPSCAAGDRGACALLDRACDHDDAAACEERAAGLVGSSLEDNKRAYALHVRACRRRRWSACVAAGTLARDGRGVDPSPERALALFILACDGGDPRGCALQKEGKLDELVGFKHARAGCEAGAPHACHALALMYEEGRGVAPDRGTAHRLHRKACDGGVFESCRAVGEPEETEELDAADAGGWPRREAPAR